MLVDSKVVTEGNQTGNPLWRFFSTKWKVADMLGKLEIEENKFLLLTREQWLFLTSFCESKKHTMIVQSNEINNKKNCALPLYRSFDFPITPKTIFDD